MIFDHVDNFEQYLDLNPHFQKALDFLRKDLSSLGKHEIDGENVFAFVIESDSSQNNRFEAHRKYIDIHFTLEGVDKIAWRSMDVRGEYSEEEDVVLFSADPQSVIEVSARHFCICFPGDAHIPLYQTDKVKKVVIKVALT